MFERFTASARDVVVRAQDEARRLDHRLITTPHLLLSLLDSDAGDLLRTHGVTAEAVRADLADLLGQDPRAADDDAAVLAALGIDITRIRQAVEANFGPGALDRPLVATEDRSGLFGRLRQLRIVRQPPRPKDEVQAMRQLRGTRSGHVPFSTAAKKTLNLSLREALRLGNSDIGAEHVMLGLLRCGDGAVAVVLDRLGTDVTAVRRDAELRLRRSA
jgi:ATP-dependent Clp protease ATP-binding subunit ClpA